MTILLHGPDDYRRTERQRTLTAQFTEKYGAMGAQHFDAEDEDDLRGFAAALRATSLFSPRRFIVLVNAFAAPASSLKDAIARSAESKTQHVVFADPANTITKAHAFAAKAPVKVESFPHLDGAAWRRYVEQSAAREGVTLTDELAARLGSAYDGDTWGLITELKTLALYPAPSKDMHTAQPLTLSGSVWQQLGALRGPSRPRRLAQLETMLAAGEPDAKLFAMLAYQSKLTLPEAAALDRRIKNGKLDYDDALLALVIS